MTINIKRQLKRFIPIFLKSQEENLNEADTAQRLIKFFEEALGYDSMTELSKEKQIKGKYVDIAIKIDNHIRVLIETKSAGTTLRDRHIEQAEKYAAEGNIRWVLLTNGIQWILYHLTFEEGIDFVRVFTVDLQTDPIDRAADLIAILHRQSVKNGELETFWQQRIALSPESIGKAIFNENVLRLVRREIRKNERLLIDEEDLAKAIHEILSVEARERIGPLRIHRKRKPRPTKTPKDNLIAKENSSTDCINSNLEGNHRENELTPGKDHTNKPEK